jgi:hypothetical protein
MKQYESVFAEEFGKEREGRGEGRGDAAREGRR